MLAQLMKILKGAFCEDKIVWVSQSTCTPTTNPLHYNHSFCFLYILTHTVTQTTTKTWTNTVTGRPGSHIHLGTESSNGF